MAVYFIQAENGGPIKIGFTSMSPGDRLKRLQTGNPEKLIIRNVIEDGTVEDEAAFHEIFADVRLSGEWFVAVETLAESAEAIYDESAEVEAMCQAVA